MNSADYTIPMIFACIGVGIMFFIYMKNTVRVAQAEKKERDLAALKVKLETESLTSTPDKVIQPKQEKTVDEYKG